MIAWALIGVFVGTALGLTGAGGAVLAVPLFREVIGVSIHGATTLSLLAVLISSIMNWTVQWRRTDALVSVLMALLSVPSSFFVARFKGDAPLWTIQTLFAAVCLFALYSVWRAPQSRKQKSDQPESKASVAVKASASGVALGALTTMTGLGGGVLLVPWLVGPLRMSLDKAVATSLLTIFLASSTSLWFQRETVSEWLNPLPVLSLAVGSLVSAFLVKRILAGVAKTSVDLLRKWVLTVILFSSVVTLILN